MMGGIALGKAVAVVSGKGGTGKTTMCAGIALALAEAGQRVLCIDADAGLRNLDISLGMAEEPAICFTDVMRGDYDFSKAAVHPRCPNLRFLTAPVTELPEDLDADAFYDMLQLAKAQFDWCLIDAPAGIGAGFRLAVRGADRVIVVSGGEPAALRDGARTAEKLDGLSKAEPQLVVNRIRSKFFKKMRFTVDDCMDTVGLPLLGIVPEDPSVAACAARGRTLLQSRKKEGAAAACRNIAHRLMGKKRPLLEF